jgi:hypothetical protein
MRARNIKPDFFTDEDLVECDITARLLYIGLWGVADRMGRLEDRPRRLKMQVFPGDNVDCTPLLDQLADNGLIVRYEVEGMRYIWIPRFLSHQSPHPNESASKLPRHPDDPYTEYAKGDDKPNPSPQGKKDVPPRREARTPEDESTHSDIMNPDVMNHNTHTPPVCDAGGDDADQLELQSDDNPPQSRYPADFERWWELYPRKLNKGGACTLWKAWKKRVGTDLLDKAVRNYAAEVAGKEQNVIKHATTFLATSSTLVEEYANGAHIAGGVPATSGRYSKQTAIDRQSTLVGVGRGVSEEEARADDADWGISRE